METLEVSEAADDSSGTSGIVKSEDGSPDHGTGRSSPPPNCAICLGKCRNKSFTDSCLHQFCFKCLLTWSRVKTECPLCKQNFKSIIHNVKSNHQYEEYPVQQPQSEERGSDFLNISDIVNAARFRYRTTLTLPRRETLAIRQFLMQYPLAALVNELPQRERTRRTAQDFRRTVYRHNLWARPLPDFTGRFRDCSPDFFRYNSSQVHRLVPWLSRELFYLLNENEAHVTYVLGRILELLPLHPILSAEFRAELRRFLADRTDHFLHEFHCFASTPYDLTGYDRHVQYQTESRLPDPAGVSQVLSSEDEDSHDSDIVMVSSSRAATPPPAPPRAPALPLAPSVVPIETISHSDSDDDSEVMVVGYIKPPHQRTPELVDLLASDSDVLVQEEEPRGAGAPPPAPPPAPPAPRPAPLVRFKLAMHRGSESSDTERHAPPPRRRRRARHPSPPSDESYAPSSAAALSSEPDSRSGYTSSSESSLCPDARSKRAARRKPRKKDSRRPRAAARSPRRRKEDKREKSPNEAKGTKRTKGKSRNGKDVKSSKVSVSKTPSSAATSAPAVERAGPSGVHSHKRKRSEEPEEERAIDRAGSSGLARAPRTKRSSECGSSRSSRESRESRRLKSVVKVMKRACDGEASSSRAESGASTSVCRRAGAPPTSPARPTPPASPARPAAPASLYWAAPAASAGEQATSVGEQAAPAASSPAQPAPRRHSASTSSSDDNIPLLHATSHRCNNISDYSD